MTPQQLKSRETRIKNMLKRDDLKTTYEIQNIKNKLKKDERTRI